MKSQYGDSPAMQRIINDVDRLDVDLDRLDIDLSELDLTRAAPQPYTGEKIPIPDTEYDRDFWRDVDDEGVGGQFGMLVLVGDKQLLPLVFLVLAAIAMIPALVYLADTPLADPCLEAHPTHPSPGQVRPPARGLRASGV